MIHQRLLYLLTSLGLGFCCSLHAQAEIRLPALFTDHAVLQRDRPIHLWGWATPSSHLTIRLSNQSVPALTDNLGQFSAYLMPEEPVGPYTLTVDGGPEEGKREVLDLLIGDVWVASGQSNMEMPLQGFPDKNAPIRDSEKEIAGANNPRIRLLFVNHRTSGLPTEDINGHWTQCTPEPASSLPSPISSAAKSPKKNRFRLA